MVEDNQVSGADDTKETIKDYIQLSENDDQLDTAEESIFENSCTYTERVLGELYRKLMKKRLVIFFLIWLGLVGTYLFLVVKGNGDLYSNICMAIVTIVIIGQLIWLPKKQAKSICRKTKELYDNYQVDKSIIYEDHIWTQNQNSKAEITIPYDKIRCITETKNLYCITLNVKSLMILDKHNFTKGTQEEFLNFIQSKNIPRK